MSSHERALKDEANNVTYQRCQYAYEFVEPLIRGKNVLDVGCGLAYGTALMAESAASIVGVDYDQSVVDDNSQRYAITVNPLVRQRRTPASTDAPPPRSTPHDQSRCRPESSSAKRARADSEPTTSPASPSRAAWRSGDAASEA